MEATSGIEPGYAQSRLGPDTQAGAHWILRDPLPLFGPAIERRQAREISWHGCCRRAGRQPGLLEIAELRRSDLVKVGPMQGAGELDETHGAEVIVQYPSKLICL